jgi:ferredoxin
MRRGNPATSFFIVASRLHWTIIPLVYFSSSNNTAYIAQIIARGIESRSSSMIAEPKRVEDVSAGKYDPSGAGIIGVGAPIYGGYAEPVMCWARGFDFTGKRVFLFSTANKHHFGATAEMINVVEKRGGRMIGALEMKFPGSVEGVFFSREEADRHPPQRSELERVLRFGKELAEIVQKGDGYADYTYRHRIGASLMPLVRAVTKATVGIIKRSLFESSCSGRTGGSCGTCAGVCPVDAIKLKDNCAEIDKDKCIACFRCFRGMSGGDVFRPPGKREGYYRGPWQLKGYARPEDLARDTGKAASGR